MFQSNLNKLMIFTCRKVKFFIYIFYITWILMNLTYNISKTICQKNQVKLDMSSKLWHLLFLNFCLLLPKTHLWWGDWGLGCIYPHQFYPIFVKSITLNRLATLEATLIQILLHLISSPTLLAANQAGRYYNIVSEKNTVIYLL